MKTGRLSITVSVYGEYSHNTTGWDIDDPYIMEAFRPIDVCTPHDFSDRMVTSLAGGIDRQSSQYQTRIAMRKDYAKLLAEQITKGLIEQMSKNDLDNGYSK